MLDLKEERQYKRLRKLGQELHIPTFETFLTLEVFDKDGKLIQRHKQRGHSWTRNAYNMFFCQAAQKNANDVTFEGGKLSLRGLTGTIWNGENPLGNTADADGTGNGYRAPATADDRGIVVGVGTNAESFEDYSLQTLIEDGSGGGQLNYVQSEAHAITYAALTLKNTLIRYFNNNSGGGIGVNEVGLLLYALLTGVAQGMVSRDKLPATVTVPDTGQLKVTYTIQLTYPS